MNFMLGDNLVNTRIWRNTCTSTYSSILALFVCS